MSTLHGGCGILRSKDGGLSWEDFHRDAPSCTARGFTYGGTPGSVIYHLFGTQARSTRLYE